VKWAALAAAVAVSAAVGLFTTIFFAFAGNPALAQAGCGPQQSAGTPVANVNTDFGPVRPAGGGVFVGGKWHYSEQNGLPGQTMAQIARGESNYHPFVVQHDPGDGNVGFGFFQFTPNAWGGPGNATYEKFMALGGQKGLENVERQFEMARWMYIQNGNSIVGVWHGSGYVTDSSPRPVTKRLPSGASGSLANIPAVCQPTAELDGDAKVKTLPPGVDWLQPVPGTSARCDLRIVPDVSKLVEKYKLQLGDCWACPSCGHASDGEHPLGLGLDITPDLAKGGSWDLVGQLARATGWNRGCGSSGVAPACPLKKWVRFVGYDGYPDHGTGNHLHISWEHTDAAPNTPAEKVWSFS
jgi:hypothetical protein